MEFRRSNSSPVPSPPARTRSWASGDAVSARARSPAAVRDGYHGTFSSSQDWVADALPQWRGRSPALASRGRVELQAQSPTAWARRSSRASPDRHRREDAAADRRALFRDHPASPYRGSWGSPTRELRGSRSPNGQASPLPVDAAAAARSDAIAQLRHDFSQREGRHCDRKWAKRALVEVNYSSKEDYSAAYSWLLDNVNELEQQEPVSQQSSLAKWIRSIGDWLEVAPLEDVQTFQEWTHERTTRPAWTSFRCETEDLHSLWGGRWETPYYLGLEEGDYIEVLDEYAQFTLWTMDGSAARLAAEGTDLRLHRGTPLARKLKGAYDNELLCVVKVVRTDQGLERIRDAEILSWEEPTATVADQSPLTVDSDDASDGERRNKTARKRVTSRHQRYSPTLPVALYKMLRVFSRWADLTHANHSRRRVRTLVREKNLDLLNRVWIGWCRHVRSMRRQKLERRRASPPSTREQRGVESLPRTSSGSRGHRTPEVGRSPRRTGSGRSPTRATTNSSRKSIETSSRPTRERLRLRPSSPPPASSESGSSPDNYSQAILAPRHPVSPSSTPSRSSAKSPGRNPSRHRSPEHRVRSTGRSQDGSLSQSRTRSSARSSGRSPSRHRPSSPKYRVPSTGRRQDQPRRTKSGPTTLRKGQRRNHGVDPAGDQTFDRRKMLRASETDDVTRELVRREAKREAKMRQDKQRKRDIAERLARIEREAMEERTQLKRTSSFTDQERLQRATDAAARRVFEQESHPTSLNLKTFMDFRTKNSPSNLVDDEEIQACREIWERFDKHHGAVRRADLAAILAEMVHRGYFTISDLGTITATDDRSQRPADKDRPSNHRELQQGKQEPQGEADTRLSTRLDSAGVKELKHAAEVAKKTGRVTRMKDGVLELEFIDDATTGLHFSRRRFGERGESSGEAYFMVAGTRKDSEAARLEISEGIELKNLLLDTVDGAVIEVDDTYAAKVEEAFIKQNRPVRLTLVPKEAYQRRAAAADNSVSRPPPTIPRAAPMTAHKSDSESRVQAANDRGSEVQQGPLAKWASHPELREVLRRWCPAEMSHGASTLETMEEKIIDVDCVVGPRTEILPITWWPKKSESDPLVVKDIHMSAQGAFAKALQDSVTQGMILGMIGAQDCSKIGYGKSIAALQSALMPRRRTKLQFLMLQVRNAVDDEPVDDGVDAVTYARAVSDFDATEDGDITIREGDYLVVVEKTDENWWRGYIEGYPEAEGMFPCGAAFVDELPEDEWRRHQESATPSLQLEQYCRSCRVLFTSAQCPRRHSDSQYLPKQMAVQQGLYLGKNTSPVNTQSRAAPPRQEPNQTTTAVAVGKIQELDERQKAVVNKLRSKLSAQAYGRQGQDPYKLFQRYDRNNDGVLTFQEFKDAVRKGGQVTSSMLSDAEVRQIFQLVDVDNNATLSVDELTRFIWGDEGSSAEESATLFNQLWEYARNAVQQQTSFTVPDDGGAILWRKISNGRHSISMATLDAGIKRHELKLYNQECVKMAFNAADESGDKSIQQSEFQMLLEYLVLFCGLQEIFNTMDRDRTGRLSRLQFAQGLRRQIGGAMNDDDIERAFVAIDLDGGGFIRFSELCTWAGGMYKHLNETAAASGTTRSPTSTLQDIDTPGYKWASHPQLKRLLQDKTLDDMCERTVVIECIMGARISPLGITWWPMKSETDSLVVKAVDAVNSPFSKQLEQVTECMTLSKVNGEDCRSGYTKSKQLLDAALKPRRRATLEFLSLEPRVDDERAGREVLSYVRAVVDYQAETAEDLSFVAGDLIAVTARDEEEWWHGYVDSNPEVEGMFPWREYVEEADGPAQVAQRQPEPEPEPEPEPRQGGQVMYCKACRCTFDTELCPANHAALDQRGGQNYITQSVAIKERWPNSQLTAQQLRGYRSSPRYPGTGAGSSAVAAQRTASTVSNTSPNHRAATARGSTSSAVPAGAQAKNQQYCKACKGCFASQTCPNNHRSFNYLPASEASRMPGWNSTAIKTVAR